MTVSTSITRHLQRAALAAALTLGTTAAFAAPVTYTLDPAHTMVVAQWSHFGFSHPVANFGNAEGTLVYDAANVSRSSVKVTMPLSGLESFTPKFDEHLRSADFFDAANYPDITFDSTKVESAGPDKLKVTGNLTIKGKSRPVVLAVTLNKAGEQPMMKVPAIGFDATGTVKRSDFGVDKFAPDVSDEVTLRITTEAHAGKDATMAKPAMKADGMSRDAMEKDGMKQEATKADGMKKDGMTRQKPVPTR